VLVSRTIESDKASKAGLMFCATLFIFVLQGCPKLKVSRAAACSVFNFWYHTHPHVRLYSWGVWGPTSGPERFER